jgi:broad specificity phosphatase PhoE
MGTSDTRLVLIRHGESCAQTQGILSGHDTCTGLSELGRRQAQALRDRLASTGELASVDAIYTSILPRAIETAAIIRPALGEPVEPQAECDWCEIHAGEGEGLTWADFQKRYPRPPDGDLDDPFRRRVPGMETWAECYLRVGSRLKRAAEDHPGQRVLVVAHGGTIGSSFVALGGLPMRQGSAFTHEALNTSITEWRGQGSTWRLVRYNDAGHLAQVDAEP